MDDFELEITQRVNMADPKEVDWLTLVSTTSKEVLEMLVKKMKSFLMQQKSLRFSEEASITENYTRQSKSNLGKNAHA